MNLPTIPVPVALLGACIGLTAASIGFTPSSTEELEDPTVRIVYNATDDDAQVFLSAGSENPIKGVLVRAPNGLPVAFSLFHDPLHIGIADFVYEGAEPSLVEIEQAYPEGEYSFRGKAVDGTKLVGIAELSHDLPPVPEVLHPVDGQGDVPVNGLIVLWNPVVGAESILFELEDEEAGRTLSVDLPGDATSFEVPNNWMSPDTEYVMDVEAIGENGNITVVDLHFTTQS